MKPKQHQSQPAAPTATKRDARVAGLQLLSGVLRHDRAIDDGFDAAAAGLEDRDRAFARLLVATTLRRLGQIDAALSGFLERTPPPSIQDVLRLSAAQILFIGTPAHAAVATGVDLAKRGGLMKFAGLVNAVLRRLTERGPELLAAQDGAKLNTPPWLWQRWVAAYGEPRARALAEAHLVEAPVDLTLKDPAAATLWAEKLNAQTLPTGSLRLGEHGRIDQLPGFIEGAWWVQDAAAALPVRALLGVMGDQKGKAVIDLCAAPGGKTLQLAAAGCDVTAVDTSAKRLSLVSENLKRTGLVANVVKADALSWRPAQLADAVLLDAPCSSTGTIRRHPDLPHLKNAVDIPRLVQRQCDLLKAAVSMLKPGGLLAYSVCSLERDEGEDVIAAALNANLNVTREKTTSADMAEFITPSGDVRTLPSQWAVRGGLDGFYAALLRKGI
jgi:16S rRNA (cytosine967-C5)-methyltransferase